MRIADLVRKVPGTFTLTDRLLGLRDRLAARPARRTRSRPPVRLGLDPLEPREMPAGTPAYAVGAAPGSQPMVSVYDASGALVRTFLVFDPAFTGGVRTAVADLTGDGVPDIVAAAGPGAGPRVSVFDGATGDLLSSFYAYDPSFTGGVNVAAGNIGNGLTGIVTGAGAGGGPDVRVFTPDGAEREGFYAFEPGFTGGVQVALGVAGDGNACVYAAAGAGGGPRVSGFGLRSAEPMCSFYAYDPSFTGGVNVATTDLHNTGVTDVVTGPGTGGGLDVRTYTPDGATLEHGFMAGDPADRGGAKVYGYLSMPPGGDMAGLIGVLSGGGALTWYDETGRLTTAGPVAPRASLAGLGVSPFAAFCWNETHPQSPTSPNPRNFPNANLCDVGSVAGTCLPRVGNDQQNQGMRPQDYSGGPVRYQDGVVKFGASDIAGGGFGTPLGVDRSWSNAWLYTPGSYLGRGWVIAETPSLLQLSSDSGTTLVVGETAADERFFDQLTDGSYKVRFSFVDTLTYNAATHQYVYIDEAGDTIKFCDFSSTWPGYQQGQFAEYDDAAGNVTKVTATRSDGKIQEFQRSGPSGGSTVTESYLFSYTPSTDPTPGQISSIVQRRQVGGGAWSTVRESDYTYYNGTEAYGATYDLKTVAVKDGAGNVLDQSYYRYWVSGETGGYTDGLKYALGPVAYARAKAALGGTDAAVQAASNTTLAQYADAYYEYDDSFRVTKEIVAASGCSACSAGFGTYTFAYTASTNTAGPNSWTTKTVETLPDGNQNTVYTNAYRDVMLKAYKDMTTTQVWDTYYRYDAQDRVVLVADPSAVTNYNDTYADLLGPAWPMLPL